MTEQLTLALAAVAAACSLFVAALVVRNILQDRRARRLMKQAGQDNAHPMTQEPEPMIGPHLSRRERRQRARHAARAAAPARPDDSD